MSSVTRSIRRPCFVRQLNRAYAMNVAETASTFAEMIVADAALKQAETKDEKLFLLEDKIQRSVAMFMNIHARFLFETRFYEERKQGVVPADKLNELMEAAQKEAFCDSLGNTILISGRQNCIFILRECRSTIFRTRSVIYFRLEYTQELFGKKRILKKNISRFCVTRLR